MCDFHFVEPVYGVSYGDGFVEGGNHEYPQVFGFGFGGVVVLAHEFARLAVLALRFRHEHQQEHKRQHDHC